MILATECKIELIKITLRISKNIILGILGGIMTNVFDCGLKASDFKIHSRYYVHFYTNPLRNL